MAYGVVCATLVSQNSDCTTQHHHLDEVITALDPLIAQCIIKLLVDFKKTVGYMFITHDLGVVKAIAVMNRGSIVHYGSNGRVLTPPSDDYTELFLSSVPEL